MIRPKIALVLGGGGARGFAHLGVLKVLEKNNIPIDIIAGSSMGAIIGGAYAVNPDARVLEEKLLPLLSSKGIKNIESLLAKDEEEEKIILLKKLATLVADVYLWNLSAIKGCITDGNQIRDMVRQVVDEKTFDQTKIKFCCVATDLNNGQEVVFEKGKLHEAIYASSAVPGVFPPTELNGKLLIDGGIITLLPIESARGLGADLVVAVNVDKEIKPRRFRHGYDILFRADEIRRHELNILKMKKADIVIEPEVKNLSWAHFSRAKEIIEEGEKAAMEILPKIKKEIRFPRIKTILNRCLRR
jgi:NTE family protein